MYRWPKQNASFNESFYQKAYSKFHHSTATDLPSPEEITKNLNSILQQGQRDFSHYIELMKHLGVKSVLDYGSSWGYGAYQFQQAGMNAHGFEISRPRVEFGIKNLKVKLYDNLEAIRRTIPEFDAVFCSHVIEHFPDPSIALRDFSSLVKKDGWLIIVVPNCGGKLALKLGGKWGPFSSSVHPLSYKSDFFRYALPRHGFESFSFFSEPFDPREILSSLSLKSYCSDCDGEELLIVAQKSS